MHSHTHNRSRWAHVNTPDGLRRRRAAADAKREALSATLPPAVDAPAPFTHWQRVVVDLYVPTHGRCDQHAAVIDGERAGLLSATQVAVKVRGLIRSRPSVNVLADARRDVCVSVRDELYAAIA
jgi:hypothetical protein